MSKYEALKTMRIKEPALWCIITGSRQLERISFRLYMTPKDLRPELGSLVDQGVILDHKGNYALNPYFPGYDGLLELQTFAGDLKIKMTAHYAGAIGPTENQLDLLALITEEPITVKHLLKKRGMGKPAYLRTILRSLKTKGLVFQEGGKWGITPEGSEVLKKR